jgi:hypothetical protein
MIARLVALLELLGGARPFGSLSTGHRIVLGVWWAILLFVICATIGRATKFIYVDF